MKNYLLLFFFVFLIVTPSLFSQDVQNNDENKITKPIDNFTENKHPLLHDKFIMNAGLYFPSTTLKFRADGSSKDDEIEFDETFDFNQNQLTFALNFHWRFSQKWHLGVEYFGIKNNKSKIIDTEIEWKNDIYPVGVDVEVDAKLSMYRVFFGRVISKGSKHELSGGLGVHLMDIYTSLAGEVYVDDQNTEYRRNSVSVIAPLPNIGFWYIYAPSDKWAITARTDWFGIKIDDYSGVLWNLAPGIKYQAYKNIGLGLNYRYFTTKFDVTKNTWHGGVRIAYHGPLLTISGNF